MKLLAHLSLLVIALLPIQGRAQETVQFRMVPITHAEFVVGAGEEDYTTHRIGSTGWANRHSSTARMPRELHPRIESHRDVQNVASLRWLPEMEPSDQQGTGFDTADARAHAWYWKPVKNVHLQPNRTYRFIVEVDADEAFDVKSWCHRGMGLGITSKPTPNHPGNFLADSLSQPGLLKAVTAGGNAERLTLTYRTGANPSQEEIGVVIFVMRHIRFGDESRLGPFTHRPPTIQSDSDENSEKAEDQKPVRFSPREESLTLIPLTPSISRKLPEPTIPTGFPEPEPESDPLPPVLFRRLVVDPVPEPSAGVLLLCSLPLLGLHRWRSNLTRSLKSNS